MRLLKGGPIRVGDATNGGGVVIGPGEMTLPIDGKLLVTKGMAATCCGSVQTFVEGCFGNDVEGRGWVLQGHKLSCGHFAISSIAASFMVQDTMPEGGPSAAADDDDEEDASAALIAAALLDKPPVCIECLLAGSSSSAPLLGRT